MEIVNHLSKAAEILQPWTLETNTPENNRLDVVLDPANLKDAVTKLVKAHWGYFSAMTGLDVPPTGEGDEAVEGQVEVLYHFCHGADVVSLRTKVPYSNAVIDSICDVLPSATLYERELIEMFGVEFPGTISTDRLLLADDWPDGVYPLRKSFSGFARTEEEESSGSAA